MRKACDAALVHLADRESVETIFHLIPWRHVSLLAGLAAFPMM
jgi:hypothetical protein